MLPDDCMLVQHHRLKYREVLLLNIERAVNAGSRSSVANFAFQGHTSREVCRYNRFPIPLSTGRGTLSGGGS